MYELNKKETLFGVSFFDKWTKGFANSCFFRKKVLKYP